MTMEKPNRAKAEPAADLDLGVLSRSIGYALRRAQMAVFADIIRALAPFDLSPAQFSVLVVIERNPGLTQSRVASALGIGRTNFVPLLNELERRGLARRGQAGDRRSHALFLTDRGGALMEAIRRAHAEHEARVGARIGEEARGPLLSALARLAELDG